LALVTGVQTIPSLYSLGCFRDETYLGTESRLNSALRGSVA